MVRRDDDDDRSGEAGGTSWVDRIVIPDDISELDGEVRALRRERRVQRRRQRLRRLAGSGRTGAPLLLVALLLVAGVAGLLVMFQPRRTAGSVTGLGGVQATDARLPDVLVTVADGTKRRVRDYRPAVFALAPIGCRCSTELLAAGKAAHEHNVNFYLVDRTLPSLPSGVTDRTDPAGRADRHDRPAVRRGEGRHGGSRRPGAGAGRRRRQVARVLPQASPRTLEDRAVPARPRGRAPRPADRGPGAGPVSTVSAVGAVRGLVRACHPEPTAAVTAVAAALAAASGRGPQGPSRSPPPCSPASCRSAG